MKKEDSFSQQFAELEEITKWFEKGDVSIEDALGKFERGLKLAEDLQSYLQGVEQRVVEMKKKFNV
ncbi:MAG: Exodeoxyribonuclease 7 small subunit [Patescibacteria group bacterium]|jgi:exodeoxyribonuclease VII small subunit|nr:Exodeoxyribonuclease 7 small subunit [Patescibacteria group bacterium]